MARPKKDPATSQGYRLNARLSDEQGRQLEQNAAEAGMTVSDYVRALAVQAPPRKRIATPERAELIKALAQLGFLRSDMSHVRADINQMLKDRFAHKYMRPEQVEASLAALEKAIAAVEAISDKVFNSLENEH